MTEYVYKLKLPAIDSVIELSKIKTIFTKNPVTIFNPTNLLKQEWKTFRGHTWNYIFSFYKPNGSRTNIHSDTDAAILNNYSLNCWAFNWIVNGSSTMEYWDKDNLKIVSYYTQKTPTLSYKVPCYDESAAPIKSYNLTEGVYLTNIQSVHRATGHQNRHTFSFRTPLIKGLTWENIVKEFEDLIV